MSAISWNEALPSPSSNASTFPADFASFMTSVATGLATSFAWPGSGGGSLASAGESTLGNLRMAVAGTSATTGGYGDGYLLLNEAHVSLHHIGSTATGLLGHASMIDTGGGIGTPPFTAKWLVQAGVFSLTTFSNSTFGTHAYTFDVAYPAAPTVILLAPETPCGFAVSILSIATNGFTAVYSGLSAAPAAGDVFYQSFGTVNA